jgi:hypothetical protein
VAPSVLALDQIDTLLAQSLARTDDTAHDSGETSSIRSPTG